MINNLIHLIKGMDSKPADSLTESELKIIQSFLYPTESIVRLLRGRTNQDGWTFWALTQSRIFCANAFGKKRIRIYALPNITHVGRIKGAWGSTVDMFSGASHEHLFAANEAHAKTFVAALEDSATNLAAIENLGHGNTAYSPPA